MKVGQAIRCAALLLGSIRRWRWAWQWILALRITLHFFLVGDADWHVSCCDVMLSLQLYIILLSSALWHLG